MLKLVLSAVLLACMFSVTAQTDSTAKKTSPSHLGADSVIFAKVERESEFPGGAKAWQQFLEQNLTYPKKAVRKNIEGTVMLQFIVRKDGTVTDIEAISGPEILRNTAVDVLKKTPKWIPAHQDGRYVHSYKKQPIVFRLTQ